MTPLLVALLAINVVLLVVVTVLYRKAKKAAKPRRVEAPNSEYKSQYVEDLEAKERWMKMDLARLHEVNREEFERVLAKVKATSVRALTKSERAFLDRMAEAHDRAAREERSKPGGAPAAGGASASGAPASTPRRLPGTS